jgi:hypothetical protein
VVEVVVYTLTLPHWAEEQVAQAVAVEVDSSQEHQTMLAFQQQ